LLLAGVLSACGPKNVVVLVPDPDGSVGSITVANDAGSVDIDTANASTTIRNTETAPSAPAEMGEKDIDNIFGQALAIQPQPPVHFILYFERNSTRLRPSSLAMLPDIIATVQTRRSEHISVVGHSDTLGDKSYNLDLSKRRALAVKRLLVKKGVDEAFIETTSHGEENPLIKTADNVGNPKNRRVEVVVR
jgi:outer membrane protein OmpA-like peptidoglycan-associated protein